MLKDRSPAFQWYSKDILGSVRVAMMTLEEEGAYRRALDFCWLNGSLPNDPVKLARLIGKNCSLEVATTVQQMFIVDRKNPKQILHERLEVERKKQRSFRLKKSKAGTASGVSRRRKNDLSPEQVLNSVDVLFEQNANKNELCMLQSSSSSSCTTATPEIHGVAVVAAAPAAAGDFDAEALISEFQNEAVYSHLNVRFVMEKMKLHCIEKGVEASRARFIGWLKRENPANAPPKGGTSHAESITQRRLRETAERYEREDEDNRRYDSEIEDRIRLPGAT